MFGDGVARSQTGRHQMHNTVSLLRSDANDFEHGNETYVTVRSVYIVFIEP